MMKRGAFNTWGIIVFDYMVLTVLFTLSMILVVPFVALVVGFQDYVECDLHSRKLVSIIRQIKKYIRFIVPLTGLLILMVTFGLINILWLETGFVIPDLMIKVLSYMVLWIAVTILMHSPTIMHHMDVSFKQLVANSVLLIFGGIMRYLTSIGLIVLYVYGSIQSIFILVFGLPLVLYAVLRFSWINLEKIKEKMK